ncbi:DUF998 domain-containing protein [Streptomyces sp. x-80]|uniref:DUF998 domain-containing protein n=1 Tax=Streptomyces sp. x-80 TaxID=2789282 RepID=UPI0039817D50
MATGNPRRMRLGAILWICSAQFFVVNVIVAARWSAPPYNPARHMISSLGTTECLTQNQTYVCSPWHTAANLSWIIAGGCIVLGTILVAPMFPRDRLGRTATLLSAVAGTGLALVGLFPDNVDIGPHIAGAVLLIGGGNTALILLGRSLRTARECKRLATAAPIVGVVGLVAVALMLTVGMAADVPGLFERIAGYPVIAAFPICGIAALIKLSQRSAASAGAPGSR